MKINFLLFINLMVMCLVLFLFFDFISVLLASVIIYLKKGFFPFNWSDVFASFFKSGYVGGLILGVALWIKIWLKAKKERQVNKPIK
ncbi:hypothetical protein [Rosenbergiella nectarea]|uniref:hypothetical protein n=1 Tax=Rosenbergiella nectarea TaxID=988801 RepID=UPI001F4E9FEC|nr:hypothetical protein [Rosenbergiella nectarea]